MSAEVSRSGEVKDTAYEYLCRLEEAKKWLEAMLQVPLPPAMELECRLQNGVILCRLGMKLLPGDPMWKKVYDLDESKFKAKGLDYRYTDNVNFWLLSLHKLGLPKVFYPLVTDIYHMTNMPKLVYCIHALSHLLKRQGKAQQATEDLYGKAKFTPDAISRTSKTLRPSDMPAFSVVENLVEEELQYQSLGLTDSFDEREPVMSVNGSMNGKEDEGDKRVEGLGGEGGGGEAETEPLFDDPKYVSAAWAKETVVKTQLNGSTEAVVNSKLPFTDTKCLVDGITAHLYSKRPRRKKSPSAVDVALEGMNSALEDGDNQSAFKALQTKEMKFPFLYSDHQERYINALARERQEGIPRNVMIAYSGMAREACVDFLEKMNPGAYIVRSSKSVSNAFVFSFRNHTGIKHWQLSDKDGTYYWGSSTSYDTLESFVEHFADALSLVTHLHVYPGMSTVLQPQFNTTEQQSMISKLRQMDESLTYGQICRVIKDVNSEIRQGRKESVGHKPEKKTEEAVNASLPNDWDSTMVISVNRLQAEQILNKEGSPGSFLVRPSEKTPGDYALAFRTATEVRHWKIVQDSGKFYVHPRPNPYNSLEDIIQHFKEAVGQETGLVMTPLVHNWAQDIVQIPNVVIQNQVLTDSGDYDAMRPLATLPVSPTRSPTRTRGSSNKSTTIGRTSRPSASLSPLNPANLTSWSVDDVCQWLVQQSLGQFMEVFKENLVDGECLMVLDNSLLKEDLGITALGHRSRIMKRVKELKTSFEPPAS